MTKTKALVFPDKPPKDDEKVCNPGVAVRLVRASVLNLDKGFTDNVGPAKNFLAYPSAPRILIFEEFKPQLPMPATEVLPAPPKPIRPEFPTTVFIGQLRQFRPDLDEEIWGLACEVIQDFEREAGDGDNHLLSFGVKQQEAFGVKTERMLEIISDQSIEKAKQAIDSIVAILTELDCRQLLDAGGKAGLLDSLVGLFSKTITKEFFDQRYKDIAFQVVKARAQLEPLQKLKSDLDACVNETPLLLKKLDAVKVAGAYLLSGFRSHLEKIKVSPDSRPEAMRLETSIRSMEARLESVGLTNISLLQSYEQAKIGRITILNVIGAIQNVLVVMLPTWRSCYYNVLTLLSGKKQAPNAKEKARELVELQAKILENLSY